MKHETYRSSRSKFAREGRRERDILGHIIKMCKIKWIHCQAFIIFINV